MFDANTFKAVVYLIAAIILVAGICIGALIAWVL